MNVVKEDMKVCHRLKWRQLIGCGRPKDQETVAGFFFHGSTSVSEDSLSRKYIVFFSPTENNV